MDNLLIEIKKKDFDLDFFIEEVFINENLKDILVDKLLNDKDIMMYYHAYYILDGASKRNPLAFYKYWEDFYSLIDYDNSYHRDIGLTLLANLTAVDSKNLFSNISKKYFSYINDEKFMTAHKTVENINKLCENKTEYINMVVDLFLSIDSICDFPEKQIELMKYNIIDFFENHYTSIENKDGIIEFVLKAKDSISPKTKKKAKGSFIIK